MTYFSSDNQNSRLGSLMPLHERLDLLVHLAWIAALFNAFSQGTHFVEQNAGKYKSKNQLLSESLGIFKEGPKSYVLTFAQLGDEANNSNKERAKKKTKEVNSSPLTEAELRLRNGRTAPAPAGGDYETQEEIEDEDTREGRWDAAEEERGGPDWREDVEVDEEQKSAWDGGDLEKHDPMMGKRGTSPEGREKEDFLDDVTYEQASPPRLDEEDRPNAGDGTEGRLGSEAGQQQRVRRAGSLPPRHPRIPLTKLQISDNLMSRRPGEESKVLRKQLKKRDSTTDEMNSPPPQVNLSIAEPTDMAHEAEDVVACLLHATDTLRKDLGVCRRVVPTNFFNPPIDNATAQIIKDIIHCVQDRLVDGLVCKGCITLHPELSAFLYWVLRGVPGIPCCPGKTHVDKSAYLFGGQIGFAGISCSTRSPCHRGQCKKEFVTRQRARRSQDFILTDQTN